MEKKESVKSPSDNASGLVANSGGKPPTWDCEKIWQENLPPSTPAKSSVQGIGTASGGAS